MRTRSDLYLFSESLWAVRTGNDQIGISSLRSGLKALSVSVNLAVSTVIWKAYAGMQSVTVIHCGIRVVTRIISSLFRLCQSGKGFFNSIKEF